MSLSYLSKSPKLHKFHKYFHSSGNLGKVSLRQKIVVQLPRSAYEKCALEKWMRKAVSTHMLQWSRSAVDSSRQGFNSQVWMFVKAARYQKQNWTCANPTAVHHGTASNTHYNLRSVLQMGVLVNCKLKGQLTQIMKNTFSHSSC